MKKVVGVLLVLSVFGAMALGSGSSKSNSTVAKASATAAKDSKETESVETTEAPTSTEEEIKYEVTNTQFHYYKNSIGSTEYYGFVEVENTGSTYLYLGDCTFDLEDDNGHLLQSDDLIYTSPDVIAPGEKGYYFNGLGSNLIDESVSLDNGVKLVPQFKLEVCKKGADAVKEYEVSDTDMKDGTYGPKITGRITNSTTEDEGIVSICILFLDENGNVLAVTSSSVTGLDAGMTKSFDCECMFMNDEIKDLIKDYKIIAKSDYIQF